MDIYFIEQLVRFILSLIVLGVIVYVFICEIKLNNKTYEFKKKRVDTKNRINKMNKELNKDGRTSRKI